MKKTVTYLVSTTTGYGVRTLTVRASQAEWYERLWRAAGHAVEVVS